MSGIQISGPLRYPSLQYVERTCDYALRRAVTLKQSAILSGPRKVGKTSLLTKLCGEASVAGNSYAFIDLALHRAASSEKMFLEITREVSDQCGVVQKLRASTQETFLAVVSDVCETRDLTLFIDELDGLQGPAFSSTLFALGHLTNNPKFHDRLNIICATVLPPQLWPGDPRISPWWSSFQIIPVTHFSNSEMGDFLEKARVTVTPLQLNNLYELTGGQPLLTAQFADAILNGKRAEDYIEFCQYDPHFRSVIRQLFIESARYLLGEQLDATLESIVAQSAVSLRERELLWMAGLTTDPAVNPPIARSRVISNAIAEWVGGHPQHDNN